MTRAAGLAPMLLLAGCASAVDSPSLAPRPIEQRFRAPDAPPPAPPAPAPADAPLAARIDALLKQVRDGDAAFTAALGEADRAAASAGAAGSESWVVAHQRVSALEASRAPATLALGELDMLLIGRLDAVTAGQAQGGIAELEAAQAEAGRIVDAQNQRIDSLRRRISG